MQDVVLDMEGATVHGGRTRHLKEGDTFGHTPFFTGAEQMEVRQAGSCAHLWML
jgi:hypothetical protein